MIKFENTQVMNFEGAIRGMRNPLNSWDKSDSVFIRVDFVDTAEEYKIGKMCGGKFPVIGPNDLALMKKLVKAGSDHRKFMRQIIVSVDIIAPLYWWKEFDTYKVGTVANSCSTMHKIHAEPISSDDFSVDLCFIHEEGNSTECIHDYLDYIVRKCEKLRLKYLETKDKKYWKGLIQLLPSSYNQRRTVTLNYETLLNIYGSRRNHKLDEWPIGFMDWIKSLPYAEELILCLTN